jgi:hypothetical protein
VTPKASRLTALVLTLSFAHTALAQQFMAGAGVGIGSGIERSDASEERPMRIARTRIIVPVDLRVDERPNEGFAVVGLVEVQPRVSVGADLRYLRWFGSNVVGFVGLTGVLAPQTLFGVDAGVDFYLPKRPSGLSLFLEPSLVALPLGGDLPDDHVLLWVLIAVGAHADL